MLHRFDAFETMAENYAKAWSSQSPDAVASFFAPDRHHAETKNYVKVGGREEWGLDENMQIKSSLGWFDAQDYAQQIAGEA